MANWKLCVCRSLSSTHCVVLVALRRGGGDKHLISREQEMAGANFGSIERERERSGIPSDFYAAPHYMHLLYNVHTRGSNFIAVSPPPRGEVTSLPLVLFSLSLALGVQWQARSPSLQLIDMRIRCISDAPCSGFGFIRLMARKRISSEA